jgi:hypothetical protein
LDAWVKEEELREFEYNNSLEVGPAIHFCESEKGVMLGEEDKVHSKNLMESLKSSFQL